MNERLNWMFPSTFVGRYFSADVRVSWWFLLVPLVVCQKHQFQVGIAFFVLLFLSVIVHEFAHVFMARWTGGFAEEVHLTPLGGIAMTKPAGGAFGLGVTAAAGPLSNLLICLCVFPGWYAQNLVWQAMNPFEMPISRLRTDDLWRDLAILLFVVNWMSLLINLLPVMPLDGGQILRALLSTKLYPESVAQRTALHVGLGVAVIILVSGSLLDMSQVVLVGTFVLMVNVVQLMQAENGDLLNDTDYGYDFSPSYESVDSKQQGSLRQANSGLIQRWRESRRLRREQQERLRRFEAEQQLDILLAKVHESGLQSLSEDEQKRLKDCSVLLRSRPKEESHGD